MRVTEIKSCDGTTVALGADISSVNRLTLLRALERAPGVSAVQRRFSYDT